MEAEHRLKRAAEERWAAEVRVTTAPRKLIRPVPLRMPRCGLEQRVAWR
ncbi:MAG: hypothetical protein MPW14_25930 (plasmid) [Candidatus Manganitrophus sp.]|nr:MAG: hypothetical protein MPW14_25930 [Candidatus Manganitrophus sp.]